jgi:hypothetical protein
VPADAGVYVKLLPCNNVPPVEAEYQSTVSPACTAALIAGTSSPAQYCLFPPLTGAFITGQEQSGAVIEMLLIQPVPSVTVIVILVPDGIELTDHMLPIVLTTVPEVLVTVPELTVTPTEYVNKSAAQFAAVLIVMVGNALKVMLTSSVDGVHGALVIVHLRTYAVPAVPVKVLVGLVGVVTVPPVPDMILHAPVPTAGVLAARVTVVRPHVDAPVWSGPALATVGV